MKVYNFKVEEYHTYFVGINSILVHNAEYTVHSDGEIEITDWDGYPEGGPKPDGKLKLQSKEDMKALVKQKNVANRKYHRLHPECKGMDIHEIHPVKFGGSPTDFNNKIPLDPTAHDQYSSFGFKIQSQIER